MRRLAAMTVCGVLVAAMLFGVGCSASTGKPAAGLEGVTWRAQAVRMADGRLAKAGAATITLLLKDGEASGSGGVNTFGSTYAASDKDLRFSEIASTLMAGSPESMDFESAYLAALRATRGYRLQGNILELLSKDGTVLVQFVPAGREPAQSSNPTELEGTEWACTGYGEGLEAVASIVPTGAVTLRFSGGSVAGDTGVNTYSATYEMDGQSLKIGPVTATEMAGSPAMMEQESAYLAALAKVTAFELDGSTLALSAHGGATLLTFVSSETTSSASMP